ncbi:MAG: acyl-CoA thioesterase [Burkholderiales bacterium]|nr:acyl-CoA thioesterase [Burkholderiales bacterium]
MTEVHRTALEISFRHCDPAGIVFYPRYAEMINDVVEHWFKHGLGCDFATLHGPRAIAIPVVKLQIDFKNPGFLGETLEAGLVVSRLGTSSLSLDITMRGQGAAQATDLKLVANLTVVFVDMGGKKAIEIPADLRAALERYRSDERYELARTP